MIPSDPMLQVLLLFVALGLAVFAFHMIRETLRRKMMRQLAQELGWQFSPRRDTEFFSGDSLAALKGFSRTTGSYAHNIMRGTIQVEGSSGNSIEFDVQAGDYWQQPRSGHEKAASHLYGFVLINMGPQFDSNLIIRSNGQVECSETIIEFPSAPEVFREQYAIVSDDQAFARRIITRELIEFLSGGTRYFVQISHQHLFVLRSPPRMSTVQWHHFVNWVRELLARLA